MVTKESKNPEPTLSDWIQTTIAKFNSRRLDEFGAPYTLFYAAFDTVELAGIYAPVVLSIALDETNLDTDCLESIIFDARRVKRNVHLTATVMIIAEEIKKSHPEIIEEQDQRLRELQPVV